jgi:hypothetical protein
VSSAIFTGVEKAGGRIESAKIVGKIVFLIAGHQVECTIVEKMVKSLKQRNDQLERVFRASEAGTGTFGLAACLDQYLPRLAKARMGGDRQEAHGYHAA